MDIEEIKQNEIIVKSNIIAILSDIITDTRVSANAVRIYCYFASKVGCWRFFNKEIKEALNIKSDHSISKYLKELVDYGYIVRQEIRAFGEFSGYAYRLNIVCQKITNGNDSCHMSKNDNWCENKEEKKKSNIKENKEEYFNNINNNNINNNNINNNLKEKINKKEKVFFAPEDDIDLEFERFLKYRKQINKTYKTQQSLNAMLKKFRGWCNGSASRAKEIVDRTIENQWQGLFEIREFGRNNRFNAVASGTNNYDVGLKA